MTSDRLSIRLGNLAGPLAAECERQQIKPAEFVRAAIADWLGIEPPEMSPGNPNIGKMAKDAANTRWRHSHENANRKNA